MGRKVYTTPMTNLYQVELEGAFASSIVQKKGDTSVTSTGHELNVIDGGEGDFTKSWNDSTWE